MSFYFTALLMISCLRLVDNCVSRLDCRGFLDINELVHVRRVASDGGPEALPHRRVVVVVVRVDTVGSLLERGENRGDNLSSHGRLDGGFLWKIYYK